MTWLEIAKTLPTGHKTRSDCPKCGEGTNTNAAIINHAVRGYSLFCNACGHNPFESKGTQSLADLAELKRLNEEALQPISKLELPNDYTTTIPVEGRLWLYSAGLTESTIRENKIGYSENLRRVVLPVYDSNNRLIWFQGRAILKGQKPKYIQPSRDKGRAIFLKRPDSHTDSGIILVEDILSAIRVGKHITTASLLGTKVNSEQACIIKDYIKATTWLDGDKAGRRGAYNIRKTLGLVCEVGNIVTTVDPKRLSDKQIIQHLKEASCL